MVLSTSNGSLPLYMQIKEFLVAKISGGEWLPGQIIPSEIQLAQELEVSQGTVRKAITELVENNVLTRKQGRGTFVATHDNQRALFHFFHIADNKGNKVLPGSTTLSCRRRRASSIEASMLQLPAGSRIIYIERVRIFNALPTMVEKIVLPSELFGDLGKAGTDNLPNNLYELYEKKYGITIHSAEEKLRAVPASEQNASLLDLQPGTPLLEIERVAMTLSRTPVEFRISHCNTDNHHYQNTIF